MPTYSEPLFVKHDTYPEKKIQPYKTVRNRTPWTTVHLPYPYENRTKPYPDIMAQFAASGSSFSFVSLPWLLSHRCTGPSLARDFDMLAPNPNSLKCGFQVELDPASWQERVCSAPCHVTCGVVFISVEIELRAAKESWLLPCRPLLRCTMCAAVVTTMSFYA